MENGVESRPEYLKSNYESALSLAEVFFYRGRNFSPEQLHWMQHIIVRHRSDTHLGKETGVTKQLMFIHYFIDHLLRTSN